MHANHTPGPWTLGDENDPLVFSPVAGAYVAQVLAYDGGSLRSNYAADAALIAAAPDLLAALQDITERYERLLVDTRSTKREEKEMEEILPFYTEQARAAIAKATGAHGEAGA